MSLILMTATLLRTLPRLRPAQGLPAQAPIVADAVPDARAQAPGRRA
jgi:hypothetical protein